MTRIREGGSVARILLKDFDRLVAVITELATPADRDHGRRGRPGADGRRLADLVQLGLQHRIARVRIHLEAGRIVALEGSDEQDLLRGALLAGVLLVGDGGRGVAEETADTLGNADQRLARLRDDVLGEDQRLARLILERLEEGLALRDLLQLANGPDLVLQLAQARPMPVTSKTA